MTQKLVIFSVEMHPFIGIRETVLHSFNENFKVRYMSFSVCVTDKSTWRLLAYCIVTDRICNKLLCCDVEANSSWLNFT